MPSNISKERRNRAFDEGRRAAFQPKAENPYDNPTLRELWVRGRTMERAGQIALPIPPLPKGKTRARPPRIKQASPQVPQPDPPRPVSGQPQSPQGKTQKVDPSELQK